MTIGERKFVQASFVQVSGCVALFTGHIDGGVYVALSTLALGIYAAANVAAKKVESDAGG